MPYVSYDSFRHYMQYKHHVSEVKEERDRITYMLRPTTDDSFYHHANRMTDEERCTIDGYLNYAEELFLHPRQYVLLPGSKVKGNN